MGNTTPAGWFPDPEQPGQQRYWDGMRWTEHRAPQASAVAPTTTVLPGSHPPAQSHTLRNVLLVIAALLILLVAGCAALVGVGLNAADQAIQENDRVAGGPDNPLTIEPGKAFEVNGFDYANGWRVSGSPTGLQIDALKLTNTRGERDAAPVEIKFLRGNEVLASANCVSEMIQPGQTVTLDCISGDTLPKPYSKVTINDSL